ncbi:MAG: ribosome-associated ATPase/putative transporter RbbA [Thiocapsa sp.]|uniref:ribosome-associated ATPase/putative transporter RbbA n=1 Tax=Thiocapsa sp. TaxID=2024551 RepID=UPI001BCC9A65|nr:ribosome-associated ATPase/putative transporter RbbA [Thiocapsa sp.]QVL47954.1 MAG: ribosome-associated ATPase/putative transporter RbbA [Thiocapsa sp.]
MAEHAAGPVVRLSGLSHAYPGVDALREVALELTAGRLTGLIGPDGVGKSTLLGIIAGVRQIQSGRVEVLGHDLRQRRARDAVIERIAYMPQGLGRNLYPSLSVRENLDFFGRLFGQDRATRAERIAELTAATGLAPFTERPAMHLSGGMKQKLGLCCALIHDPELLILDEPTTGVDPLSRRRFWELMDRLRRRRPDLSILVSTAYMEEAERFDTLVAMDAGRVLAAGSVRELCARTGERDMESVFVALLPAERRGGHRRLVVPPRTPDGDGPPAIRAEGLTRRFGDFTAVDRVSLSIHKGEIFGFLGSNGSGKTTTMRMLTGLLPVTEGEAWVFDRPVDAEDTALRRRLGFMSQSFSLYGELSVRQNLDLHARLYRLPAPRIPARIAELTERFDLAHVIDARAESLPLGVRQRLSLAVAVIHAPELLILDEPTSGVDPIARDRFWEQLLMLSREQGVTIFISTHFMNEAERCDRISLMHGGRVLAEGTPADIKARQGAATLEDAFIAYMEQGAADAGEEIAPDREIGQDPVLPRPLRKPPRKPLGPARFSLRRLWAYTRREGTELRRDPIRLAFALLGPAILMIAMGFGISFDVDEIAYAVLDHDRTPASRDYLEHFAGSTWFFEQAPPGDAAEMWRRLESGRLTLAIEIPPGFGRDVQRGARPEVGFIIDGAIPFRGDTIRGYAEGVHRGYLETLAGDAYAGLSAFPVTVETRFRYNQDFKSVYAMVPGILMLLLIMIPATMTAVGVVREKELGSIINLYATPTKGGEFLLGKQLPYVGLALLSYLILLLMALFLFRVPLAGSLVGLTLGAVLFVFASTGLGLLMSTFMRTQIAAVFGTAIVSTIPTILFSGMLVPVSALTGPARIMGYGFPSAWFNHVSVGSFTKGLTLGDLWLDYLVLAAFGLAFFLLGLALLRTRER